MLPMFSSRSRDRRLSAIPDIVKSQQIAFEVTLTLMANMRPRKVYQCPETSKKEKVVVPEIRRKQSSSSPPSHRLRNLVVEIERKC